MFEFETWESLVLHVLLGDASPYLNSLQSVICINEKLKKHVKFYTIIIFTSFCNALLNHWHESAHDTKQKKPSWLYHIPGGASLYSSTCISSPRKLTVSTDSSLQIPPPKSLFSESCQCSSLSSSISTSSGSVNLPIQSLRAQVFVRRQRRYLISFHSGTWEEGPKIKSTSRGFRVMLDWILVQDCPVSLAVYWGEVRWFFFDFLIVTWCQQFKVFGNRNMPVFVIVPRIDNSDRPGPIKDRT